MTTVRKNMMPIDDEVSATSNVVRGRPGDSEFRRGWKLVLAATIGVALGLSPIPFYELGLFAPALAMEFHWPIATVMGGLFFMMLGVLFMAPLTGWLTDRFGVRVVTLTSLVGFSIALTLFSLQTGSIVFYFATWMLLAIAGTGTLPITWTRTVNQSFDIRKGLALGVTLTGTGISALLLKPLMAIAISAYGWRTAFLLLAVLPVAIALPIAWAWFRAVPNDTAVMASPNIRSEGMTLSQALREWRFWMIGLGIFVIAFAVAGPIPNMELILGSRGVSRAVMLQTVPLLGLAVIAGRLCTGWLIDRFWAPAISFVLLSLSALAVWSLGHGAINAGFILLYIIGVGFAAGMEFDVLAFLVARYFGMAHYGSVYGLLYTFYALGSGIAPYTFGRAFDSSKSFADILSIAALLIVLGGVAFLTLGRYRYAAHAATNK